MGVTFILFKCEKHKKRNIHWILPFTFDGKVARIYNLLSNGKEEKGPMFEIKFPLVSVYGHFKIGIFWRRGEIWARKNTTYITGANGWREIQNKFPHPPKTILLPTK